MKNLLYLKDDQIKDFIQLLYHAYRETMSDPKHILAKKSFGPAHLRAINLIERYPGTSQSELMFKLKITKQSLNRVLRDLIKKDYIFFEKGKNDTRLKHIHLSESGNKLFNEVFSSQKKRIYKAFLNSDPKEVMSFDNVIKKIINE